MTSLIESSTDMAQDTQNTATAVSENLIEHPRGAEPGKPGRRAAFYFEQKTRLPDAADGKGRGGARYGRTGTIHTPHGDIHTPAFVPVATQVRPILPVLAGISGAYSTILNMNLLGSERKTTTKFTFVVAWRLRRRKNVRLDKPRRGASRSGRHRGRR